MARKCGDRRPKYVWMKFAITIELDWASVRRTAIKSQFNCSPNGREEVKREIDVKFFDNLAAWRRRWWWSTLSGKLENGRCAKMTTLSAFNLYFGTVYTFECLRQWKMPKLIFRTRFHGAPADRFYASLLKWIRSGRRWNGRIQIVRQTACETNYAKRWYNQLHLNRMCITINIIIIVIVINNSSNKSNGMAQRVQSVRRCHSPSSSSCSQTDGIPICALCAHPSIVHTPFRDSSGAIDHYDCLIAIWCYYISSKHPAQLDGGSSVFNCFVPGHRVRVHSQSTGPVVRAKLANFECFQPASTHRNRIEVCVRAKEREYAKHSSNTHAHANAKLNLIIIN